MENKKQVDSSSSLSSPSSFSSDLFGAKDSSPTSASNGIFSSLFPPPSTVAVKNCSTSELIRNVHKQPSESQLLNAGIQGDLIMDKGASNFVPSKERNSIFQERSEPCPLSSSLYYGGQEDMYLQSSSPHTSGSYTNYKKDGGVDDPSGNNSHGASRGNWWQGSLYY